MERNESGFQSKGQILDFFQAGTNFTFEESIRFLDKHQWDINILFSTVVRRGSDINDDNYELSTPDIVEKNDQHLAQILHSLETGSNAEKDVANLIVMGNIKRIGIAAHNNKKAELIECLRMHRDILAKHKLYGTGTTGSMVEKELNIPVTKFESGPLGGDQQLGAKITKRELDILIFFVDPLDAHAHGADVNALIRLSQVYGIICATTTATVDFIFNSKLMDDVHTRKIILQTNKPK